MAAESSDTSYQDIRRIGKLSNDGIFVFDVKQRSFVYFNASLAKILEISKKVLQDEPALLLDAMPEEDRDYVMTRIALLEEKQLVEDVQMRWIQNNVEKFLTCNCYLTADKSAVVGFVRDVSKLRQHEDYLINFGARKDAILDTVSQQLSTPLNLSKFTADLIEKAVQEQKFQRISSHVALIREVTDECISVINNLMHQEHMESPAIYTKTNRFDMHAKTLVVLNKLKELNPDRKFTFKSPVSHLFMTGDEVKFSQVVHNILSNAIKFTPQNGEISVVIKDYKKTVEMIIEDNGIGIPDNLQPYIFDRHTRAARKGLNGERSIGIGLHISKKLVELQRGKISFESKENKGSRFVIEFPKY